MKTQINLTQKGTLQFLATILVNIIIGSCNRQPVVNAGGNFLIQFIIYPEDVLLTSYRTRRPDLTWKYNLENTRHKVRVVWENPIEGYAISMNNVIVYGSDSDYKN